MQAIALLVNLSEIETINHTMRAALLYAAERIWGLMEDAADAEDAEPDGPEGGTTDLSPCLLARVGLLLNLPWGPLQSLPLAPCPTECFGDFHAQIDI